jgi:excisionase family DNA binding protein
LQGPAAGQRENQNPLFPREPVRKEKQNPAQAESQAPVPGGGDDPPFQVAVTQREAEKVFSTFQVAKICRVAPVTIIRWAESGKLASYKTPGGHRRIVERDLLAFLERHGLPHGSLDGTSSPRILIIDDEMLVRRQMQKALKASGLECACETSSDGIDALLRFGYFHPQLVVLDINIPWVDGLEICRRLRAFEPTRQVKVIVVTGYLSDSDREEIVAAGADEILFKPFEPEQFLAIITRALGLQPS